MQKQAKHFLETYFGYKTFRDGQELIIKSILNKKDTLGIMPTGGGKSLCYQIPALCFDGLTIVISPLISLMKDQIDFLHSKKYPSEMLNSTVSYSRQMIIKRMIEDKELKLVYLTPERFRNQDFLNWLCSINISCFVIDEAHCISEWGHDFRPEYRKLVDVIKKLGTPPTLALTATATPEVREDIVNSLRMKAPNIYVSGFNRENLIYGVQNHYIKESKNKALIEFIKKVPSPGIVYTTSVKDAEIIYNILKTNLKKNIGIYHGSLKNDIRKKMQEDFLSNEIDVLVATNAFGMGVNKKNIRFVVHYSIPGSIEAYYQETGRAGRDNKISYCLLFTFEDDEKIQDFFIQSKNPSLESIIDVLKIIKKISLNNLLYANDHELLVDNKKEYNKFNINSILKQLHFMGCIDYDYINQEKIEINVLKTKIDEIDKDFLEELFLSSIEKNRFISIATLVLTKRLNLTEKELKDQLKKLAKKKIISFHVIKKGQTIKIIENDIAQGIKNEYKNKIKRKIEIDRKKLHAMTMYANLESCRRKYLLNYFGENFKVNNCKKCDICRGTYKKIENIEWNKIQKEIVVFFIHHDGKIGKTKAIKILKGSLDIEPKYRDWDEYGILRRHDTRDIESEFNLLLKIKIIQIEKGKYAVIKLTYNGMKQFKLAKTPQ